jgi:hypothetical protein
MYSAISQRGCEPLRDSLCEAATLAHTLLNDLAAQIEELPERTTHEGRGQPAEPSQQKHADGVPNGTHGTPRIIISPKTLQKGS